MRKTFDTAKDVFFWIVGCFIYAFAVKVLLEPNAITIGGFTGIASILSVAVLLPTGVGVFLLNIPLIVLQFIRFGGKAVVKTACTVVILSLSLDVCGAFFEPIVVDNVLAAVFGGVITGVGLALIMLHGATTGGVEIIARLVNSKFRHITVGRVMLFFDFCVVVLSSFVYKNAQSALYSLITIYASTRMIDALLYGADRGKILYIITDKKKEISEEILSRLQRGVTCFEVTGGYTGSKKSMLMCVVRRHEAAQIHNIVNGKDREAFVVVSDAGEIIGEGFKYQG
ncbi:MAG: YitT family protein [Clostridiales bacterium]|nr:YitT family protein [Candidatus Equinaster intestinalis]